MGAWRLVQDVADLVALVPLKAPLCLGTGHQASTTARATLQEHAENLQNPTTHPLAIATIFTVPYRSFPSSRFSCIQIPKSYTTN